MSVHLEQYNERIRGQIDASELRRVALQDVSVDGTADIGDNQRPMAIAIIEKILEGLGSNPTMEAVLTDLHARCQSIASELSVNGVDDEQVPEVIHNVYEALKYAAMRVQTNMLQEGGIDEQDYEALSAEKDGNSTAIGDALFETVQSIGEALAPPVG